MIWDELQKINPKYSFREHFARQPFRQEDVEKLPRVLRKPDCRTNGRGRITLLGV